MAVAVERLNWNDVSNVDRDEGRIWTVALRKTATPAAIRPMPSTRRMLSRKTLSHIPCCTRTVLPTNRGSSMIMGDNFYAPKRRLARTSNRCALDGQLWYSPLRQSSSVSRTVI
jgi:hypothetical protein